MGKRGTVGDRVLIEFATVRGEDFSGRRGREWVISKSRFEGCRFENLRVDAFCFGAGPWMSEYVDCSFDGSRIKALNPGRARFIRCSFRNVRLHKWLGTHVEFIDCVFSGALSEINFDGAVPQRDQKELGRSRNVYRGNDFSDAEFTGVAFKGGVDLLEQRLPQGEGYLFLADAEPVIRAAFDHVDEWTEPEERHIGRSLLNVKLRYIEDGQRQLLLSPHDFTKRNPVDDQAYRRLREVIVSILAQAESGEGAPQPSPHRRTIRGYTFDYFRAPDAAVAMRVLERAGSPLTAGDDDEPVFDGVEAKGVEPFIVLGHLVALVRGVRWNPELVPSISLWPSGDQPASIEEYDLLPEDSPWKQIGPGLEELGSSVRDTLADADDARLSQLSVGWAQTEELRRFSDVNQDSLLPLVEDLVRLARRAREANEQLYCWSSPH